MKSNIVTFPKSFKKLHPCNVLGTSGGFGLHLKSDRISKADDNHEGSGLLAAMDLPENDTFPPDSDWIWKRSQIALSNQFYTGWVESSTNKLEGKCVITDHISSWMWKTATCYKKYFFICEIDAIRF